MAFKQDKKTGRIIKGGPQDTNKNGTAGAPCGYCKDKEIIQKITDDYLKIWFKCKYGSKVDFIDTF